MDKTDKRLLYELDSNSRQGNNVLAKKLHVSKPTIAYRINRLVNNGIIKRFIAIIDLAKLGYTHFKVLFKFINTTPTIEEKIIKYFKDNKNVLWLATITGDWDLNVSFVSKSIKEFHDTLNKFVLEYGPYILEKKITIMAETDSYNKSYLIQDSKRIKYDYGNTGKIKLDDIDYKIISILSKNARERIVDISLKVDLNADSVKNRIKKLEQIGIITGYRTDINLEKIGYKYVSILFKVKSFTFKNKNKTKQFAHSNKNITYYVTCLGDHDFQYEIEYPSDQNINDILKEIRTTLGDIIMNYELIFVDKEVKIDFYPL